MISLIAIFLILLGITILYFVGRRRFYRRSITGLQQFRTYEAGLFIRTLESVFRLLAVGAILTGLFLLGVHLYNAR